jgi:hypothetical protein
MVHLDVLSSEGRARYTKLRRLTPHYLPHLRGGPLVRELDRNTIKLKPIVPEIIEIIVEKLTK